MSQNIVPSLRALQTGASSVQLPDTTPVLVTTVPGGERLVAYIAAIDDAIFVLEVPGGDPAPSAPSSPAACPALPAGSIVPIAFNEALGAGAIDVYVAAVSGGATVWASLMPVGGFVLTTSEGEVNV